MSTSKKTKADCNGCGKDRNHDVLHVEATSWVEDQWGISGSDTYQMLKCCGCEAITTRHIAYFSEEIEPDGTPIAKITYFPPSVSRRKPKWMFDFLMELEFDNGEILEVLKEVYVALDNNLLGIAAMGVRSIVENAMIAKVGDQGSFAKNIKSFQEKGFVSALQAERLETILDAGHAAIHRLYRPAPEDVSTLMDITESLIETCYIHGSKVKALKKKIPQRKKRK